MQSAKRRRWRADRLPHGYAPPVRRRRLPMPPLLPSSRRMRVLVVGADGEIGRALAAHLAAAGAAVAGTTRRRPGAARAGRQFLDLAADPEDWQPLPAVDAAVICAAVARVADCERDPDGAR